MPLAGPPFLMQCRMVEAIKNLQLSSRSKSTYLADSEPEKEQQRASKNRSDYFVPPFPHSLIACAEIRNKVKACSCAPSPHPANKTFGSTILQPPELTGHPAIFGIPVALHLSYQLHAQCKVKMMLHVV